MPISDSSKQKLFDLVDRFEYELDENNHRDPDWDMFENPTWRKCMFIKQDAIYFPHGSTHVCRVMDNVETVGTILKLSEDERLLLRYAAIYHDIGRSFVENGVLSEEEHSLGSWVYAQRYLGDIKEIDLDRIGQAIVLHNCDTLPKDATIVDRILRDVDRVDALPWSGVVRFSMYPPFDFKHPDLCVQEETILSDHIKNINYYNTGDVDEFIGKEFPWEKNFEKFSKKFVIKEIFPFLSKNNLLSQMIEKLDNSLKHINGVANDDGSWLIEPVMPIIKEIYKEKIRATFEFKLLLLFQEFKNRHVINDADTALQVISGEITNLYGINLSKEIDDYSKLLI